MISDVIKKRLAQELQIKPSKIEGDTDTYTCTVDGEDREYRVLSETEADDAVYDDIENLVDEMGIDVFGDEYKNFILNYYCNYDWESDMEEDHRSYAEDIWTEEDDEYGNRLIQECCERDSSLESDDLEHGGWVITKDNKYVYSHYELTDEESKALHFVSKSEAENYYNDMFDDDPDYQIEYYEELADEDFFIEKYVELSNDDFDSMDDYFSNMVGSNWFNELNSQYHFDNYLDIQGIADWTINNFGRGNSLSSYDGDEIELGEINGENFFAYRTN